MFLPKCNLYNLVELEEKITILFNYVHQYTKSKRLNLDRYKHGMMDTKTVQNPDIWTWPCTFLMNIELD